MKESWQAFWQRQSKPLHQVDNEEFYRKHAAELNLLTGNPAGRSVLDLGCGDGSLFRHLGFDLAARYVGVDFSDKMLDVFRAREPQVELLVGSAIRIPTDDKFDLVFSNGLVQYLTLTEFAIHLRAVLALLRPDGIYVCGSFPARERFASLVCGRAGYPPRFSARRALKELGAYLLGRAALGQWYSLYDLERCSRAAGASTSVYGSLYYLYRYHAVFRAADTAN